jgi:alpha-glucosidase
LHEDLADLWDALADRAVAEGTPLVRPLFLQYPGNAETYPIYDEFLVGESLLVAPVITPDSNRAVYLPEGEWLDPWSGARWTGPRWLPGREYSVERLPLYVRADRPDLAEIVARRLAEMPRFAGGGRTG